MKTALLYASPEEIKYVNLPSKIDIYQIGLGCMFLKTFSSRLKKYQRIISFGSCGLLKDYWWIDTEYDEGFVIKYNEFITPYAWDSYEYLKQTVYTNEIRPFIKCGSGITWYNSLRDKDNRERLADNYTIVDLESYYIGAFCSENNIKWTSVRYPIDCCDRKCMPTGINHFWRKYQHRRMQRKFGEMLNEITN